MTGLPTAADGERLAHFASLYATSADPWEYDSSWYEQRKRSVTLASLPQARYRRCFEPGCSTGALTLPLAGRCDEVLAADAVPAAVDRARRRTIDVPGVTVSHMTIPRDWPTGLFDLVVLSEIGYYLEPDALSSALERTTSSLAPGGHLAAVHWLGDAADFAVEGGATAVHERIAAMAHMTTRVRHVDVDFLLTVSERT